MRADAIDCPVSPALTGDQALDRLARSAARRGFGIAYDLLGDAAEAEDAVQESLARACASYARLRDPAALEGWFYRVLTNFCLRTLRRRRVGQTIRRLWGGTANVVPMPMEDTDSTGEKLMDLVDDKPRADEALVRVRDVTRTLAAVAELPAMQRAALVLRYGHDLSVEQVAEALGIGPGTVKTHLVRGLRRLREGQL